MSKQPKLQSLQTVEAEAAHEYWKHAATAIAQKIEGVRLGETRSIKLSKDEPVNHDNLDALCGVIKEHRLDYPEVSRNMSQANVQKLLQAVQECGSRLKAKIQCIQWSGCLTIDLDAALKNHPDIECAVNTFYRSNCIRGRGIEKRIINPESAKAVPYLPACNNEDKGDKGVEDSGVAISISLTSAAVTPVEVTGLPYIAPLNPDPFDPLL